MRKVDSETLSMFYKFAQLVSDRSESETRVSGSNALATNPVLLKFPALGRFPNLSTGLRILDIRYSCLCFSPAKVLNLWASTIGHGSGGEQEENRRTRVLCKCLPRYCPPVVSSVHCVTPTLCICVDLWGSPIIVTQDKAYSALPAMRVVGVGLERELTSADTSEILTPSQSRGNPVPALDHRVALWHFDIARLSIGGVIQHVAVHLSPQDRSMLKEVHRLCFFSNWCLMHQPNACQAYKQFPRSTGKKAFTISSSPMSDQCLSINASDGTEPWWPEWG